MIAKRILSAVAAAAVIALPLGVAAASPAAAADKSKATVTVFHAIPGVVLAKAGVTGGVVDVCANGAADPLIPDFAPGTSVTADLAPGAYTITIHAAAGGCASPALLTATVDLKKGKNYDAVAYLTATGSPTVGLFPNNLSQLPANKGRLTVRHAAAAPAVDVFVNGSVAMPNLSNGQQQQRVVPKGTYQAAAGLAGAGSAAIALGPVPVTVKPGVNTIVYAWGVPPVKDAEGNTVPGTGYVTWSHDVKVGVKKK